MCDHVQTIHDAKARQLRCAICGYVLLQFAEPPSEDEQRKYHLEDMRHDAENDK